MQILQLFGVLIIVNSLIVAAWFFANSKALGAGGSALMIVAVVTGLALTFHERAIEITFGKVATLKAAAEQATTDANEIASIRARVEAQSATLDLVAKASSDAKTLLEGLRAENEKADIKLKILDEKTSLITNLSDGEVRMGTVISGGPTILMEQFEHLKTEYNAKRYDTALESAKTCITIYEKTKKESEGAVMSEHGINPDAMANIYAVGSELAGRAFDFETALVWAKQAVTVAPPTPERTAQLVMALINAKKSDEANQLISDTLRVKGTDTDKFKSILQGAGIIK